MSDFVVDYMVNKKWEIDDFHDRKNKIITTLKTISKKSDITSKLGGFLLCIQFEEQLLKEAIQISSNYIKAEIWPSKVDLYVDLNEKTFGSLITYFKHNSIEFDTKTDLINLLNIQNKLRNKIVHNIFQAKSLKLIEKDVDRVIEEFDDVVVMLLNYYDKVCYYLYDLARGVDFSLFVK